MDDDQHEVALLFFFCHLSSKGGRIQGVGAGSGLGAVASLTHGSADDSDFKTFHIIIEGACSFGKIFAAATVTNTGSVAGKEVVQIYLSAPQGKLGKAAKVLCTKGFAKNTAFQKSSFDAVALAKVSLILCFLGTTESISHTPK